MAEQARLIFSRGQPKQIGPITIDVFSTEDHSRNSSITSYPVEDGSEITDHIRNEPTSLNVTGIIESIGDGSNILDVFNQLNELIDSKETFSVITGLKVYENMFMSSLNISRNALNGGSLPISAKFTQIKKVQSQSVVIPISQISNADDITNKQTQPKADVGKATSGQTQGATEEEAGYLDDIESQVNDILDTIGV